MRFVSGMLLFGALACLGLIVLLLFSASFMAADPAGFLHVCARFLAMLCALGAGWIGFAAAAAVILGRQKEK